MAHKAIKFIIHKGGPTKSKPWCADILFDDGVRWVSWSYGFKTKKGIVEHCQYVKDSLPIETA